MKLNKLILPLLASSFALTGCSALLSKIGIGGSSSVKKPTMSEKGGKVERTQFVTDWTKQMEEANLIYKSGQHYSSFDASNKTYSKEEEKNKRAGKVILNSTEEETSILSMKYDASSKVAKFETTYKESDKSTTPYYTTNFKSENNYKGGYQYGKDSIYYIDDVEKKYRDYNMSYDSYDRDEWMDRVLYDQMSSFFGEISYYFYNDKAEFYERGSTYTVEIIENTAETENDYYLDVNYKLTYQMVFDGNNIVTRFIAELTRTLTYRKDATNGAYSSGDTEVAKDTTYGNAELTFKSMSLKETDVSSYTKNS